MDSATVFFESTLDSRAGNDALALSNRSWTDVAAAILCLLKDWILPLTLSRLQQPILPNPDSPNELVAKSFLPL